MKKLLLFSITLALCVVSINRLSAQSDKEIIKSAQTKLTAKACDSAYEMVLTVKNIKNKSVQEIIKKAYPCVINKNNMKANAIKVAETEDDKTRLEKYQNIVAIYRENSRLDSLLNINVKPDVYKALSKKKRNDNLLSANLTKIDKVKGKLAAEKLRILREQDSLAIIERMIQDSISNAAKEAEELANAEQEKVKPKTKSDIAVTKKPLVTEIPKASTGGKKYYIIAGSYGTMETAQAAVDKLKTEGFPNAEVVGLNSIGKYRISFSSYSTRAEAEKEIITIKEKTLPDAWIHEQ